MITLDLFSERIAATGGMVAEGAMNTLGRPSLDPLAVLVREAVQNSWDARRDGMPLRFFLESVELNPTQQVALRRLLGILPEGVPAAALDSALIISDYGTIGLGGPTRADQILQDDEQRNFVAFLRNIGRSEDTPMGGGTYGYGKAILYGVSRARTIIVYSRCNHGHQVQNRLMAAALGKQYVIRPPTDQSGVYSGRHWWGQVRDGVIEPLLDEAADEAATALNLPVRSGNDYGTSVMILAPDYGSRTQEQALSFMRESLMWYAWPRLIADVDGMAPATAEVGMKGQRTALNPEAHPRVRLFADQLRTVRTQSAALAPLHRRKVIQVKTLRQDTGILMLGRYVSSFENQEAVPDGFWPSESTMHHVALVREPELVVRYLAGPASPVSHIGYTGIFRTFAPVDRVFARSEPPTHDDWRHEGLPSNESTMVNATMRHIRSELKDFVAIPAPPTGTGRAELSRFAEFLGQLLPGDEGFGASIEPPSPASPGTPGRRGTERRPGRRPGMAARVMQDGPGRLQMWHGQRVLGISLVIQHPGHGAHVTADVAALVEGSEGEAEREPPVGGQVPQVLGWEAEDGEVRRGSAPLVFASNDQRRWKVLVYVPADAAVQVRLQAQALDT